ncbi:murein hydrolase activator EnvC family protein [Solidesulfovibrio aerotolerans]|uniref:murein hydrolase activator EnvC family protein n=1 Tax=Solidesulfovibrio aerotolerans TaxID=295255 RepID=UPI0031B62C75
MKAVLAAWLLALALAATPALARKPAPPAPRAPQARLSEARVRLAAGEAETVRLSRQLAALEAARDAEARRLSDLLAALWPLRAEALASSGLAGADWAEADRRYVWTRALYAQALAARQAFTVAAARVRDGRVARDAAALRLLAGQKEADTAFSEAVSSRVRELESATNAQERDGAAVLGQALDATIAPQTPALPTLSNSQAAPEARDGPDHDGPKVFTPPPGGLSWPAAGNVLTPFSAASRQGRQGIVVAVPEGSPVTAAAAGRVVFTGLLRGLGRVVILTHEDRCHTVYACLSESTVSVGEAVPREAALGRSGYCNQTRAPGVYFELRFREKALNPAEWLAVRR